MPASSTRISEFAPEWIALTIVALMDLIWAQRIGFHVLVDSRDVLPALGPLLLLIAARKLRAERSALVLEFFCLSVAGVAVFGVMSYLALASAYGPLLDAQFLAADRALGFDWLALYQWIVARPALTGILIALYASILVQALVAAIVLGLRQQRREMTELYRIIFVSSFITCTCAAFFPALGPFKIFAIHGRGAFLVDMQHLLTHRDLTFALSQMTGVISFPSFHATLALIYGYGFWRAGAFGRAMTVMNALMLFSVPFIGGHYLVDVLAGLGVFGVALAVVKAIGRMNPGNSDVFASVAPPLSIANENGNWRPSAGRAID